MINEIIQNKWMLIGFGILLLLGIAYSRFLRKNKHLKTLEREYKDIINSDEYKVKI